MIKGNNKTLLRIIASLLALFFVIAIPACSFNNRFVDMSQGVDQSWAEVQNAYQRRADLIPNLVNTVKGYAEHEKSTLASVTNARAGLSDAYKQASAQNRMSPESSESMQQFNQAQDKLKGALDIYVNAVREAYPDLKANENFIGLQTQLEGTENRIAVARKKYTQDVAEYNKSVMKFPARIFAGIFGYDKRPQFQADANAQSAPVVEF